MTADPFDVATTEQRAVVFALILAYFALFVIEIVTGNPDAAALGDVVVALLAIPAGLVIARRATATRETEMVPLVAGISFVIAGVGVGYSGISALTGLPTIPIVEAVGSLALIVAVVLYLYYTWA